MGAIRDDIVFRAPPKPPDEDNKDSTLKQVVFAEDVKSVIQHPGLAGELV